MEGVDEYLKGSPAATSAMAAWSCRCWYCCTLWRAGSAVLAVAAFLLTPLLSLGGFFAAEFATRDDSLSAH
jgi:hypothetical protein